MACGGMIFIKNFKLKKKIHFILFHLFFFMFYCCSINLKRQSEHSGLRPGMSSLVCFKLEQDNDIFVVKVARNDI